MAHAYFHAKSSARRYGGVAGDYLWIHAWMDHTKLHFSDNRHRLVLHNSWGMSIAEQLYGLTFIRQSDSKVMPLRPILEQHILEDLGFIPSLEQCLSQIDIQPWMYRQAKQLSKGHVMRLLTREEITTLAEQHEALQEWEQAKAFAYNFYGPSAHTVTVETHMEYNDEGGYDPEIDGAEVTDADGNELKPDTTLPAWEPYREDLERYQSYDKNTDISEIAAEVARDYLYDEFITAHVDDITRYTLSEPPTLLFPQVYAAGETPETITIN